MPFHPAIEVLSLDEDLSAYSKTERVGHMGLQPPFGARAVGCEALPCEIARLCFIRWIHAIYPTHVWTRSLPCSPPGMQDQLAAPSFF